MRAFLPEKNIELGNDITLATSLPARMKGLLGKKKLDAGKGLLIRPCNSIHTFCMKFPIDVIFLDKENRVVALYKNFPKNRLTSIFRKAASVLELPAGTLGSTIDLGDHVDFS